MLGNEPKRPSLVAPKEVQRALRGDLDKIALMALRREPERRYGTADQLAEDVRRHLEHRPVKARTPTMGYLFSSFVARHRARRSAHGGDRRRPVRRRRCRCCARSRIAESHRVQAEMRFNDVRKLANALIFDIDNSISDVPGTGASRKVLVRHGDPIPRRAQPGRRAGNPELQLETAAAYRSPGRHPGFVLCAVRMITRARLRATRAHSSCCSSAEKSQATSARARENLRIMHLRLSDVLWVTGDVRGSLAYDEIAYADTRAQLTEQPHRRAEPLHGGPVRDGLRLQAVSHPRGQCHRLAQMREAIKDLESLTRSRATVPVRRLLGVSLTKTSELLMHDKQFAEALDMNVKAMHIFEPLVAAEPNDSDYRVNLAAAQHYAAAALMNMGRLEEARKLEQAALSVVEALHAAEPAVSEFDGFVGMAHTGACRDPGARRAPGSGAPVCYARRSKS